MKRLSEVFNHYSGPPDNKNIPPGVFYLRYRRSGIVRILSTVLRVATDRRYEW